MGLPHLFKLTAAETGGLLSFEEFTLAPGAMGARPHVHEQHDEHFYVVSGELTFHTGADEVGAGPGTLVAALRGSAHGFRNASDAPATAICLYTPGGYEDFFRDVHRAVSEGAEPTAELMAEFRSRYHSHTL
ncbi:cupin domain-containing protein [Nocardioides sp. LML1-1-1.1]|uniref:cupin domain-containing protein n=1 Tax=Nocardioides sp. LML1-1-1.1 TaxID=3135248 RepID=UPI003416BF46